MVLGSSADIDEILHLVQCVARMTVSMEHVCAVQCDGGGGGGKRDKDKIILTLSVKTQNSIPLPWSQFQELIPTRLHNDQDTSTSGCPASESPSNSVNTGCVALLSLIADPRTHAKIRRLLGNKRDLYGFKLIRSMLY